VRRGAPICDLRGRGQATEGLYGLGVVSACRGGTGFQGSIYVTLERDANLTGGLVARTGNGLVTWLNSWMSEEPQRAQLGEAQGGEARRATSVRPPPRLHEHMARR
jgi:hypothetical protein